MMVLFLCGAIGFLGYKVCLQDTDEFEEMDIELDDRPGTAPTPNRAGTVDFEALHLPHRGDFGGLAFALQR
jgi:hypothetical protein